MPFRSFAIVPAAGRSQRMGQDKLRLPWGDSTVLGSLLTAWKASHVTEVVVVARREHPELLAFCTDVTVVTPETDPPEMKDSVLIALDHIRATFVPKDADVWLLAPADMPQLDSNVVDQLLSAHDVSSPEIIVPICRGKRGHPVLFPWQCAAAVGQLADDQGVNALLQKFPVREVRCSASDIHGDLDTPEDYERLREKHDR